MTRHRMAAADVAWLHMDRPANRMVVTSVLWTDEPLDWDAVRTLLRERLVACYPRFSQRVVELTTFAWWEDVDDFDLETVVRCHRLRRPGGRAELEEYVSSQLHHPLPLHLPLWQVHFVNNYRTGSAIVTRIHHCIADGTALARVLLSLCDAATDGVAEPAPHTAIDAARRLGNVALDDLAHPAQLGAPLERAVAGTRALARVVTLAPDVQTCLRGTVRERKRVLWSDSYPLAAIRTTAHQSQVTVNELVLAVITGALRSYLAREDGQASDIRAIVPVNLRPLGAPLPRTLGNRFGLVYLTLPVSVDDFQERVQSVRHESRAVLRSSEGLLTFDLLELFGNTLYGVEQAAIDLFASKGSVVITNVCGPNQPLLLAGRRLCGTVAWPPESGNVALGISIISLDGRVVIGVLADVHLVRDPEFLLTEIERELSHALTPLSSS